MKIMNSRINKKISRGEQSRRLVAILLFLFFIPTVIYSQQLGTVVTFDQSVTIDEDGGVLSFPSFVTSDPLTDEIYIIDGKSRIVIYTPDFFPILTLDKKDGVDAPQSVAIDRKGNIFIIQSATEVNPRSRISVFSSCLKWERDIYPHGFAGAESFEPYRIAVDSNGNLYIAANYYPGVLQINTKGRLLGIMSPEKDGKKVQINNVTTDKEGRVYLVSEEESHIYVYDKNRSLLMKFGEKGGSTGKLSRPRGVGVDMKSGRMYVSDYMRHTITVYDKEGNYLFEFGGMGWSEGWFQHPSYLTIDDNGRILVADTFNQRVQVFNSW